MSILVDKILSEIDMEKTMSIWEGKLDLKRIFCSRSDLHMWYSKF